MADCCPVTPDGRYFVVRGRLWRRSNPALDPANRERLVQQLMDARRAVKTALRRNVPRLRTFICGAKLRESPTQQAGQSGLPPIALKRCSYEARLNITRSESATKKALKPADFHASGCTWLVFGPAALLHHSARWAALGSIPPMTRSTPAKDISNSLPV